MVKPNRDDQRTGLTGAPAATPMTQGPSGDPIDRAIEAAQPHFRKVGGQFSGGPFELVAPVELAPMEILSLINILMNWGLKAQPDQSPRSRLVIPTPVLRRQ